MCRFVILHHETSLDVHWDVMLESELDLATWSIAPQCLSGASFVCAAVRLSPHRKHYLDYEGEISQNRGVVCRIDVGTYEQRSSEVFILYGTLFAGTLTIRDDQMIFASLGTASSNRLSFTKTD